MAGTVNFGPVTVSPGTRTFGPAQVADSDSQVVLTVDRTVPGGLNSLTTASQLSMEAQLSTNGGVTWHAVDTDQPGTETTWGTSGGPATWTDKQGVQHVYTVSSAPWTVFPGTGRRIQAVVTVSGPSPVAVAGSIVTS